MLAGSTPRYEDPWRAQGRDVSDWLVVDLTPLVQ